ncbi:LuxR C-terminal-related transcriptional regulator [Dictyobacter arantiisoli]|uniref:Helix-turn-helix transcriptional regulator n=1 Tax=Dictyobacter arantiisoli TaxID=2014874 RepID=A0A5A5T586_9CHLR|nr:LuxR C-terminal-related transcriptional regulator [Dictyobacter arantiisoli]GCF06551.1 helix-turn-helix transcriptional regulator [Dictyobacter arantiisoli]
METSWNTQLLLATKLTVPRSYAQAVVPRVRLYQRLATAIHYPLTLLAAPAGFGKTTLLGEWLRDVPHVAAWLSLERSDNDLMRFWHYCVAALGTLHPEFAACIQPTQPLEEMLTALINTLVSYPTEDIFFVLDDYHVIDDPAIHESLAFFLAHLPAHCHLIISTRVDPALPLARLRVRGQILELRSTELRFTLEETEHYLVQGLQLSLESENMLSLQQGTEGWAAGLRLIAHALQGEIGIEARARLVTSSTHVNRDILHYLTEEVWMTLPAEIQEFLLETAILTRLHPALCDAVTGQTHGQRMLDWLEHANLFISLLDEQNCWYRYHPLFADLLRQRLLLCSPERLPELHLRASCWYEQAQMMNEAVEHALAADAFERAADLIEYCVWPLWIQGKTPLVFDWLARLHGHITLAARPMIAYLSCLVFLHAAQFAEYQQALCIARECWQETQNVEMLSCLCELQAYCALCQGDGPKVLAYTQEALAFQQHKSLASACSHVLQGAGYLYSGDLQQARVELLLGQRIGIQTHRVLAIAGAALYQGDLCALQGQFHEAMSFYSQCITNTGNCVIWFRVLAHVRAGQIYCEWNDLSHAREQSARVTMLSEHFWHGHRSTVATLLEARIAWAADKQDEALDLLDQLEAEVQRSEKSQLDLASIAALRIKYWLAQGKSAQAQDWLARMQPADLDGLGIRERELWCQARARVLLAQHQPELAVQLLVALLPALRTQGRVFDELQIQTVLVQAYAALEDSRHIRPALERLLTMAEAGGYRRLFLEEGQGIKSLLSDLYHRQQKRYSGDLQPSTLKYIHSLLLMFGCNVEPRDWQSWQKRAQRAQASLEQLSERELEVLKLIAEGNSNQQIACTLVVAESTIKTHLNNIYSKLNVNSRLQALTRAHAVGLLSP